MLGSGSLLPFAHEPSERVRGDAQATELLSHHLSGLRTQADSLSHSVGGTSASLEPPHVLGAPAGLLSPLELPTLPPLDPTPPSGSGHPSTPDDEPDMADAEAQELCIAACHEARRVALDKLLRRRVVCEIERARAAATAAPAADAAAADAADAATGRPGAAAAEATGTSSAASMAAEIARIDCALAALPPAPPPASLTPGGLLPADAAALSGGAGAGAGFAEGRDSLSTAGAASAVELEALIRRRLATRKRTAPLHAYLSAVDGVDANHTLSTLHEAVWLVPAHLPPSEVAVSSPLPSHPESSEELRAQYVRAALAVRGAEVAHGASDASHAEPTAGAATSLDVSAADEACAAAEAETARAEAATAAAEARALAAAREAASSPLAAAEFHQLHSVQTEAAAYRLMGPSAEDLAVATAAAAAADRRNSAAAAQRALSVAHGRLRLAERRVAALERSAYTCDLAVGDDVRRRGSIPPPPPPGCPAPLPAPSLHPCPCHLYPLVLAPGPGPWPLAPGPWPCPCPRPRPRPCPCSLPLHQRSV